MSFYEGLLTAIKSIWASKMRSALTMLGIIIGIFAVAASISVGQSSNAEITQQIESMGTNLLTINITDRRTPLSLENVEEMRYIDGVAYLSPTINNSYTIKSSQSTMESITTTGVMSDYQYIRDYSMIVGRFITDVDSEQRQRIAVIGYEVAEELYGGYMYAVGENIAVDGTNYTIVGVMDRIGSSESGSEDEVVFIPFETAQRMMQNTTISSVYVSTATSDVVESTLANLESYFYELMGNDTGYRVFSQSSMLESLDSVADTQTMMLGGIAAISLLVGGIGIMNIMLVSVSERTREIGIRKSVGATRGDILMQFLIESVIVSGLGGILGVALAYWGSDFIGQLMDTQVIIEPLILMLSMGFSMVVGIVFGLYPAVKASKLNPIEALRYE